MGPVVTYHLTSEMPDVEQPSMKYVIAGNYQQAKFWARENGWQPSEWRYVSHSYDLQGLGPDVVIVSCGQPWLHPGIEEINQELLVRSIIYPETSGVHNIQDCVPSYQYHMSKGVAEYHQ